MRLSSPQQIIQNLYSFISCSPQSAAGPTSIKHKYSMNRTDRDCEGVKAATHCLHVLQLSTQSQAIKKTTGRWQHKENIGCAGKCTYCIQPARVITDSTEENQEGTLCGPDKQAACHTKQPTGGPWACRLCPSTGPRAPRRYLSSLKSGYVFGQHWNKRADRPLWI